MKTSRIWTTIAALMAMFNFHEGHGYESTPGYGGKTPIARRRQHRFHPDIPNGKWVMKYHRNRN